jgi:hypothetical protein
MVSDQMVLAHIHEDKNTSAAELRRGTKLFPGYSRLVLCCSLRSADRRRRLFLVQVISITRDRLS